MKKSLSLLFVALALLCSQASKAQTTVLEQNFDAFTNGSVESPETKTDIGSSYSAAHRLSTMISGWSGKYVYEAGGSLLITDGGNVTTGYLNTSTDNKCAKVTMDIKCRDSYGGGVQFTLGYSSIGTVTVSDGEWHTVHLIFTGSSSAKLKIAPYFSASGVIIDNMKVETSPAFIAAPTAYQPTVATKTSFTAKWKSVSGATDYKLNVYSYNGTEKDYLLKDQSTGVVTTKAVEGLDASKKYFYTVKVVKGEYESEESDEFEVVPVYASIDAPVATDATDVSNNGFTANWNAVDIADNYLVTVNKLETLKSDQTVTILSEDFSKVTSGTLSSVTIPSVSREYLDKFTNVPGWYAVADCYAAGYMGIYPLSTGTITTPAIDLSKADGKFALDIKIASNAYGTFKEDACKINIYNGSSETPVKTIEVATSADGFSPFHYDLECGAAETYIEVEYSGSSKLFIDDVKVTQDLKAGDVVKTMVAEEETTELSKAFALEFADGISYDYTVKAIVRTVISGDIDNLYSAASNTIAVSNGTPTGINTVKAEKNDKAVKMIENGRIVIERNGVKYHIDGTRL